MLICVTGKSGSGKSYFSRKLAEKLNIKYIDVDRVGHQIYENKELLMKLRDIFGDEIFDKNGKIERKKLGKVIFSQKNSEKIEIFNKITWQAMEKIIEEEMGENTILDWIFLPKTKYWDEASLKILIKAQDENKRIEKVMKRDGLGKEYVLLRDKSSMEYNENDFDLIFQTSYNDNEMSKMIEDAEEFLKNLYERKV